MSFETNWKTVLSSILEELTEEEFRKMLFYLDKIPQGVKDGKAREEIPNLIVQYYGTEGSISEIDKIMKKIPRNDAKVQKLLRPFVEKLKKRQEEKGPCGAIQQRNVPAEDSYPYSLLLGRRKFVEGVSDANLNKLLGKLLEHGVINDEEMQSAKNKTRADNARIPDRRVRRKGNKPCLLLINTPVSWIYSFSAKRALWMN
ncbi:uncharacterized protein LOC120543684 [Perca fluviatilis]|uniref:uncharacterized protein LOC120543684 n=1 Tax=Perca fluviatilis TaxID=8168 RepID=UPI001962BE74|nr:uncharacterized protein LOC120543684 [Perca fluviatilis]